MTTTIEVARDGLEARLAGLSLPGRRDIETAGREVIVTMTDIPFVQHGMKFISKVRLHFTLELRDDGAFRTYWGKHDWRGKGADREPCRTENASESHADLDAAVDWLVACITARVQPGR